MSFSGILAALAESEDQPQSTLPPSVQAKRLGEAWAAYQGECRFKSGNFVTPRANSGSKRIGAPHIVLEVIDPRHEFIAESSIDTCSNFFGRRIDMRVAVVNGERLDCFWVESWEFEPWTGVIAA